MYIYIYIYMYICICIYTFQYIFINIYAHMQAGQASFVEVSWRVVAFNSASAPKEPSTQSLPDDRAFGAGGVFAHICESCHTCGCVTTHHNECTQHLLAICRQRNLYLYGYIYVCECIYIYTRVYIHICTYMYIYIHVYIYTYIYIYI